MKTIVAVDQCWGIGKNNDLLFSLPEDMKFFRQTTSGKVVVMGSNTLKSFPGGNPLKNRTNIVLYPGGEKRDDCTIVDSIEELKDTLALYPSDDTYVVGGAYFYKTMIDYCDTAHITKVDANGEATVFFPNLDDKPNWTCVEVSDPIETNGLTIRFCTYSNSDVKPLSELK